MPAAFFEASRSCHVKSVVHPSNQVAYFAHAGVYRTFRKLICRNLELLAVNQTFALVVLHHEEESSNHMLLHECPSVQQHWTSFSCRCSSLWLSWVLSPSQSSPEAGRRKRQSASLRDDLTSMQQIHQLSQP